MTTQVSASFGILYDVKSRVSRSFALEYDVRARVSKSVAVRYNVRMIVSPGKVASILYDVRSRVSKPFSVRYGVRVPISSSKTAVIRYHVRSRVSTAPRVIQYDTEISGTSVVSRDFVIRYHTLVTTDQEKVNVVTIEVDEVPPQILTTSF